MTRSGDGTIEVPAEVVHDWWNAGAGVARVRVEVEAEASASGRPAERFVSVIQVLWSLGALGRVDAKGMPDTLWLAAIAHEYPPYGHFACISPLLRRQRRASWTRRSSRLGDF